MAARTPRLTVGDYFTLQRGTTYKSQLLGQPGPVLLGLATIQRNGGFRRDSLQTYGGNSPDKLLVRPGELYLSLKDVTQSADLLGAVARLPLNYPVGRLTQDTVRLEPKTPDVPLNYLYWLLRTPQYRGYCRSHATGTTNLGLARNDFLAFPALEPTPTQSQIVDTLTALEEKIELNRRMSETLEAMARALFKSWFVDFEPVRAKAEGRDPGLPPDLAALFPDRLVESEHGEIPEGWEFKSIGELAEVIGGSTPKTERTEYWEGGTHHWVTPKDLSRLSMPVLLDSERKVTDAGLAQIGSGLLPPGTVLLSSRAPIGYLAITEVPVAINQGFIAMKPRPGTSNLFLLRWVSPRWRTRRWWFSLTGTTLTTSSSAPSRVAPSFCASRPCRRSRGRICANGCLCRLAGSCLPLSTSSSPKRRATVNHLVNRKPLTPIQHPLRNVDKPGNNSRKFNG